MAVGASGHGLPADMDDKIRWTIQGTGTGTQVQWRDQGDTQDQTWTGDATKGRGRVVFLKLVGLPRENSAFGAKTIVMEVPDLGIRETTRVKIFFPRDATNNPGGTDPNWFYYWNQTPAGNPHALIDSTLQGGNVGATPAMTQWVNGGWSNKQAIHVQLQLPQHVGFRPYFAGESYSNIALFALTLKHEGRHVWQIGVCDAQVPERRARGGWSFNVDSFDTDHWNHMNPQGQDLDHDRDDWPDAQLSQLTVGGAWRNQSGGSVGHIEEDACNFAASLHPTSYNEHDWASPGSQYTGA
jgi:hypothetical protein